MVPSASVAWAQLYQITSPSFFAAGTTLLFHSAMAAWNFAGDAEESAGAAAGVLACARTVAGAAPTVTTDTRSPEISDAHLRIFIAVSLRLRPRIRRRPSARP